MSKDNLEPVNPFYITLPIPDKYFCDRQNESEWLISLLTNGDNVVLISPRRMGKTSLIEHCYADERIKDRYHTFYIDILPTGNLAEFVYMMGKCIYDSIVPKGLNIIKKFFSLVGSLRTTFGYDAISGMPSVIFSTGAVPDPLLTLDEIFNYLQQADKPCIFTIDEFQQIGKYPEKNIEALLRSYIQRTGNCHFVYAGSERHMMVQMFNDISRPFYNSSSMIDLRAIPKGVYVDFIVNNFKAHDKSIDAQVAEWIYDLLDGNTFYIQRLCNRAFAETTKDKQCDKETAQDAINHILAINETFYRERLSLVSIKHKPLLYAVAREGRSRAILSGEFINRHGLHSSSAVQNAAKQLVENGLLNLEEGTYSLTDKFLAIWIRRKILAM